MSPMTFRIALEFQKSANYESTSILNSHGQGFFATWNYTYTDVTTTILQTSLEHYYANLFAFLRGH